MDHKILIVESDPPSGSRVVRALRTAGFRVVAPASPATTLATFDRVRPELVLIGSSLPNDGGVTLCQEIKKTPHGGRTPVALLLDRVEIDLQPLAELGWDRLIESATGDQELVEICRQLIEVRGTPRVVPVAPPAAEVTTDFSEAGGSGAEQLSLEDAIDQVLTFEHEESVAHVQRSAAQPTAPESTAISPSAAPQAPTAAPAPTAAAPLPRETAPVPTGQPEPPRYQTATLLGSKPRETEEAHEEPASGHAVPARRWWVGGAAALAAVLIAVGAWLGFSGGESPGPATVPTAGPQSLPEPIASVPFAGGSEDLPEPGPADRTTVAASLVAPATESASVEQPIPPAPRTAEPKPAVVKASAKPTPKVVELKPPAVKTPPPPAPRIAEPKPAAVEAPAQPTPEVAEPKTPVATEPESPPPSTQLESMDQQTGSEEPAIVVPPAGPALRTEETVRDEVAPTIEPAPVPFVEPFLLERVEPAPSPKALKRNRGATIVLRLLVNEQGNVIRVVVSQGVPGSEVEAAAVNAVLRWKYRPAMRDGVPVQAWTEERFTFR